MNRRVICCGLLIASSLCKASETKKPVAVSPVLSLTYEADVQSKSGDRVTKAHISYDKGKFRQEHWSTSASGKVQVGYTELYNKTQPSVIWIYNATHHSAWPDLDSEIDAISNLAKKEGEAVVRQRYHIPPGYKPILFQDKGIPQASLALKVKSDVKELTGKPLGTEKAAGYSCQIYEGKVSYLVNVAITLRAWVEPRTGLILKLDELREAKQNSPAPPSRTVYTVLNLKILKSIPSARFDLPQGTTANIPRTLSNVQVPKGVKRVPTTGPYADTGINLNAAN